MNPLHPRYRLYLNNGLLSPIFSNCASVYMARHSSSVFSAFLLLILENKNSSVNAQTIPAAAKESEEGAEKLEKLLEPLRKLGKESINKTVRNKCKEALGDERLPGNEKKERAEGDDVEMSDASEGEEDGWGGIED